MMDCIVCGITLVRNKRLLNSEKGNILPLLRRIYSTRLDERNQNLPNFDVILTNGCVCTNCFCLSSTLVTKENNWVGCSLGTTSLNMHDAWVLLDAWAVYYLLINNSNKISIKIMARDIVLECDLIF